MTNILIVIFRLWFSLTTNNMGEISNDNLCSCRNTINVALPIGNRRRLSKKFPKIIWQNMRQRYEEIALPLFKYCQSSCNVMSCDSLSLHMLRCCPL